MEYQEKHTEQNSLPVYETGSTNPPRNKRGLIAVLLALVILLCGISSAVSWSNIRLLEPLSTDEIAVSFSFPATAQYDEIPTFPELGIHVEDMPDIYRRFYRLPEGVYVSEIETGSPAHAAGLMAHDIILSVNSIRVRSTEDLTAALRYLTAKQSITLTFYRDGLRYSITITS